MAKNSSINPFSILIIIMLASTVMLTVVSGWFLYNQTSGNTLAARVDSFQKRFNFNLTPKQEFEIALDNTINAKSMYADFKSDVATRITGPRGISQTVNNNVDGYISGSSDGALGKMEIRISSDLNPKNSIVVETIITENDLYIRGPQTMQKWWKMTADQANKDQDETTTDASLFGFDILSSIFSENKALFKAIEGNELAYLGDNTRDNRLYKKFKVEIGNSQIISAMKNDENSSEKNIEDAKTILASATLTATFEIDAASKYITNMKLELKNLKQVPVEEAVELGLSSQHDIVLNADFSRYNVPSDITIPTDFVDISSLGNK